MDEGACGVEGDVVMVGGGEGVMWVRGVEGEGAVVGGDRQGDMWVEVSGRVEMR